MKEKNQKSIDADLLQHDTEERKNSESAGSEAKFRTLFDSTAGELIQNDEKNIRQLFDDYLQMYASRDDRLTKYFSENFSGFTGGGDFLVKDKEQWVAITRQDFDQVKDPIRIELKDVAIQSLADTIAVATGFFIIHLPIKDHILSRETARLVLIFSKESDGWKISHSSISIPYYLVREGEIYPMKELVERNQHLEDLVAERTIQLSKANDDLQKTNEELARTNAEHMQAVEALQQSNQKLEAIISATPDGIGMISLDGKMQFVSDKLAEMNGYSIEQIDEFIGKPVFGFIDPSSHKLLSDNIRKLIAGEAENKLTEYLAVKKDNSRFYIDVNSTVLVDSTGKPKSILFVERDITERKLTEDKLRNYRQHLEESEKELKQLNSSKDKLLSIIGHDLKNPFQIISSFAEMLKEDFIELSEEEKRKYVDIICQSSKSAHRLLDNLLNWAQSQTGGINFLLESLQLKKIVDNSIDVLIAQAKNKNIELDTEINEVTTVMADTNMLDTILRNLISNAIKFTNNGGTVKVSADDTGEMVLVKVSDNGIGLSKVDLEKLFRIDVKNSDIGDSREKGTGLGLILCKEFAEKHNGKIWAESEVGKGSTFSFTLPKN
ncbi:MAG: sensor histidine kinase [Melioribacteraceae bacterium]